MFPRCPPARAQDIAAHSATRGSGRVARTAAGQSLETGAVTAAVRAAVRHLDTGYDALPTAGTARKQARTRVSAAIETVPASWRQPPGR
ncbi:DUF2293 domain-containing protein [Streptomyces sp. AM8-1-1]|uniref:DUF2293 domain-containing protein n=1 Tax=Streptomyces sp. AM8-1-1 TaxID=3075825 RepID=UPI0028C3CBA7|nr:DUF2293 domain-containing protein [Streptomyces sp. AM8-1-1]WNO75231.1 DUF2293 domain-containing protein [Streptomyces sp. AM8-1-1]